ncbi:MAG: helix-turn-helix domain-containing protein [Treponema sp.]|nr:helix-turn-helix domain-containing protein [Treponema sp.]
MNIKAVFGENLKKYRKKKNLSQEQFAEKLDITNKHLSELETGKSFVSAELLERISEVLSVSASALFYAPNENLADENSWSKIENILNEESERALNAVKFKLRDLGYL